MSSHFDTLEPSDAERLVTAPANFKEIEDFIEGDHWQSGNGFTGPMESGTDGETRDILNNAVHSSFTSENTIGEVTHRRVDAVLSKSPQFSWTVRRRVTPGEKLADDEQERIDEANESTRAWFNEKKLYDVLQQFAVAICSHQRSYLRLYVPPDRLTAGGTLRWPTSDPAEALQHVFVEHVKADVATLWTHRRSMYEVGIVITTTEEPDGSSETSVELSYLDPDQQGQARKPLTVARREILRTVTQDKTVEYTPQGDSVGLDLNGALLLYEGRDRRRFVSQQMIEQQKALNTASTEMRVVNDDEGFPVRLIFNALPPGRFVRNDDNTLEFEPDASFRYRPGSLGFLQGVEVEDVEKNVRDIKQPAVGTLSSGDPQNYINEMKARRRAILNEANQLFVEIMDDATATGESRIHALFDYLLNAQHFKRVLDGAGAWMVETARMLADHLAGQEGRDADLGVDFNCKINIPFLPASLVDTLLKLMKAGVRSRETLMNDTGVDDVEAELDRIENTPEWRLEQEKIMGEVMTAWKNAGAMYEIALLRVMKATGMTKEEVETMMRQDQDLVGRFGGMEDDRFAGDGQPPTETGDDEPGIPGNPSGGRLPEVSLRG